MDHNYYIEECDKIAKNSTCLREKCGSVIVKDGEIIGKGFNSPPKDLESQRRCSGKKKEYDKKVTDKTCCIHAEQRAIIDALKKNPEKIKDAVIYFSRIDNKNNRKISKEPYCTICSKIALEVGISKWILFKKEGIKAYNSEEYNLISFNFFS